MTSSRAPRFVHLVQVDVDVVGHYSAAFLLELASHHNERAGDLAQAVVDLRAGNESALLVPTEIYEPLLAGHRLPAASPSWSLRQAVQLASRGEGEFHLVSPAFDAVLVQSSRGRELVNAGLLVFYNGQELLTAAEIRSELPRLVSEIVNGPLQTELLVELDGDEDAPMLALVSPDRFLAHHDDALRRGDAPTCWGDSEAVIAAGLPDFGLAEAAADIETIAQVARERRPAVIGEPGGPLAVLFAPLD